MKKVSYNIDIVAGEVRKVRVGKDMYYCLGDILGYYGYSRYWFHDHRKDLEDRKCKTMKRRAFGSRGGPQKVLWVSWYLFNRLITVFVFQKLTGNLFVEDARWMSDLAHTRGFDFDELIRVVRFRFGDHPEYEEIYEVAKNIALNKKCEVISIYSRKGE